VKIPEANAQARKKLGRPENDVDRETLTTKKITFRADAAVLAALEVLAVDVDPSLEPKRRLSAAIRAAILRAAGLDSAPTTKTK
jgi:hypothetical protein